MNDYLQGNAHLVPELEIDESEKNMECFLHMRIPVTRVFINNSQSGINYYDKWNASVTTFLNLYGSKITHLRLAHLGMIPSTSERNFIDRLTNLRSLTARNWVLNVSQEFFDGTSVVFSKLCPAVYNQLTNLDITIENCCNQQLDTCLIIAKLCFRYLHGFSWPNLRRLALPEPGLFMSSLFTIEFLPTSRLASLKTVSFQNYCNTDENRISYVSEMELQAIKSATFLKHWLCCQRNIFMEMVNSEWFCSAKVVSEFRDYDKAIKSLVDLHPSVVNSVEFPYLERLEISTSSSNIYHIVEIRSPSEVAIRPARSRPLWPSLKKLWILVDSILTGGVIEMIPYDHPHIEHAGDGYGFLPKRIEYPPHCPSLLFRFLFNSYILECLKELTIDFKDSPDVWSINQSVARWIAMSCPNVTRFSTTNWNGSSRDFYTVWMGMTSLEELVICNCRAIDIHAFSGEEITDPSIVRLTSAFCMIYYRFYIINIEWDFSAFS